MCFGNRDVGTAGKKIAPVISLVLTVSGKTASFLSDEGRQKPCFMIRGHHFLLTVNGKSSISCSRSNRERKALFHDHDDVRGTLYC